jgi:hypothetical protein
MRWQIQNATQKIARNQTLDNCTAIHIWRGDSGLPRTPFRRYAGISEYLQTGNIGQDEVIFILTDDWTTTIYKAEHFYPDYNFIYMDQPLVNITYGGFDGHIPSGDEASEFVAIQAETTAAAHCHKMIHTQSGFMSEVKGVRATLGLPSPKTYSFRTSISKDEAKQYARISKDKRAELSIEKIFREAAESLRQRTQSKNNATR